LLVWLDTSGLALYFLDRVIELQRDEMFPPAVFARLQQNLADNTARTESMIAELSAIHREFQRASLSYATLKGISFWPSCVPRPELRSQLDLDFLVGEESAREARRILESRGYHLRAISGRSWEFKKNEAPGTSLKDHYKNAPYRSVELHIGTSGNGGCALLSRAEMRRFRDIDLPVLSAVDLFLGQGMHVFKHVCSEFLRTAHLLEFRRHAMMQRDHAPFWSELRARAEDSSKAAIALGVVALLTTRVMGDFAPDAFVGWTVDRLPAGARLWVQLYGERAVFASFPGSKLYLLLQKELAAPGVPPQRSLRQSLLPPKLPPPIVHAGADETFLRRLQRYRAQLRHNRLRLRFHAVEGFRYLRESFRWQQYMNRVVL
jgi:hypothetical protein